MNKREESRTIHRELNANHDSIDIIDSSGIIYLMETTIPTQEIHDSNISASLLRRTGLTVSAAALVLTGCASHDVSSAPEPNKPANATFSATSNELEPNCVVADTHDNNVAEAGDFTYKAHFPVSDSAESPTITLTSKKPFALGNVSDYDMAGDWVTAFPHQPESNNQAVRKDGQYEMSLFNGNADLTENAGRLLLQGHGEATITCEATD